MKLGMWDDAVALVNQQLRDKIKTCSKLQTLEGLADRFVISMILRIMARSSRPAETHSFYELCLSKGFRPSTEDVNSLLLACNALSLPRRAISFFEAHFLSKRAKVVPSNESLSILRDCIGKDDPFYQSAIEGKCSLNRVEK